MHSHDIPLLRGTAVGCSIPTGPLGRTGELRVGIIGMVSPGDIIGVMPCIGLTERSGMGVRTGIVGTMGMLCMDPIPQETFHSKSSVNIYTM